MTTDEKLAAILAAVQTDPGNRGLARDPHDNLFTSTQGDFQAACRSIATQSSPTLDISTGFFIPTGRPPAFETDGPLGSAFLFRALTLMGDEVNIWSAAAIAAGIAAALYSWDGFQRVAIRRFNGNDLEEGVLSSNPYWSGDIPTHRIALERVGRAYNGRYYSMRGRDITEHARPIDEKFTALYRPKWQATIGIGDGGNEIGMGKIPHETIVKNIPNGDLIHCRVPTDHLVVAGVSNWGAYALAAGVYVLRGVKPPADLFDPDREREILTVMVREGPLVDGVTGQQTATVDGLTWDEYAKPLLRIREIMES
jgi:hypothetical protein